jgi:hypothetical protein
MNQRIFLLIDALTSYGISVCCLVGCMLTDSNLLSSCLLVGFFAFMLHGSLANMVRQTIGEFDSKITQLERRLARAEALSGPGTAAGMTVVEHAQM